MTFCIVILSILLLLFLLLFSPIKISVLATENAVRAKISFLYFFHKRLYPLPPRKKKKKSKSKNRAEKKNRSQNEKKAKSGALARLHELRSLLASILIRLPRTFSLKIKQLRICVATSDPAKTALLYGTITASLAFTLEWLDRHILPLRRAHYDAICVYADFESEKIRASVDLSLSTSLCRLLAVGVSVILPHFLKQRKKRKLKSVLQKKESNYVRSEKQAQRAD